MRQQIWTKLAVAALLAIYSLALISCGKPKQPTVQNSSPSVATDAFIMLYAAQLKALQNDLAVKGYSIKKPMSCIQGDTPAAPAQFCRMDLSDPGRGGATAVVGFMLFDHDVTFAKSDAAFKEKMRGMGKGSMMETSPKFVLKDENGKVDADEKVEVACHQVVGALNSTAYCDVMYNPQIFYFVGVRPAQASSEDITLSLDGSSDSSGDLTHASELGLMVWRLADAAIP